MVFFFCLFVASSYCCLQAVGINLTFQPVSLSKIYKIRLIISYLCKLDTFKGRLQRVNRIQTHDRAAAGLNARDVFAPTSGTKTPSEVTGTLLSVH